MEPVAEITAAEKGVVALLVEGGEKRLRHHGVLGIGGMMIDHAVDHPLFIIAAGPVQGHQIVVFGLQALQQVHGVGYVNRLVRSDGILPNEIPAAPGPGHRRQNRYVGMENGVVGKVPPGRQQLLLLRCGIIKKQQGLVGVGGNYRLIEMLRPCPGKFHADAVPGAENLLNRGTQTDLPPEAGDKGFHIT